MSLIAIDPGTHESQLIIWREGRINGNLYEDNATILGRLRRADYEPYTWAVIESVASYGMPVGAEVFDTCYWGGRMYQALIDQDIMVRLVPRMVVKTHLCHSAKAKDANIRQALIDRFGGKDKAIGNKANPGVLYGVKSHGWAALALAVTAYDLGREIGKSMD